MVSVAVLYECLEAWTIEPMNVATKRKLVSDPLEAVVARLAEFVPVELRNVGDPQTAIPRLARDEHSVRLIEDAIRTIPTK